MRKIDKIIYQEVSAPSVIALLVLTFVVFTREFGRLTELLIRKNADAMTICEVVVSLLPSILIFTLPISFLIGTLVAFSRLSTDSEVVALRAGGVSLYQMLRPVLKIGVGVAVITLLFTHFLLPEGNWNLRQLRHKVGLQPVRSQIKPRVFNEHLPGMLLYVEDINLRTSSWKGVFLADTTAGDKNRIILSKKGEVAVRPDGKSLQIHFEDGSVYKVKPGTPEKDSLIHFRNQITLITLPEIEHTITKPKRPEDKTVTELLRDLRQSDLELHGPSRVELHSRTALPLSALIFAVLGVTLGISSHRGGRGYGFVISVTVAFIYYVLFATGTQLAKNGVLSTFWGTWGANLLWGLAALLSLRYATTNSRLLHAIRNSPFLINFLEQCWKSVRVIEQFFRRSRAYLARWIWSFSSVRLRTARVIDLYLARSFFFYLLPTLAVCVALFYLFTFFELIDEVFTNKIPYDLILDYFFYLLPHVLMLLVPISILIATLVTYGVLDKTCQVVAFKSCGIGVYRIALPVLSFSLVMSVFIFFMQENILPYANQRQDNLRNVIKGQPIQTYYQLGKNWIFGKGNRLYNYSYFDSEHNIFAEMSVYDLDIGENRLIQHVYAQRAVWDATTANWTLFQGWRRSFGGKKTDFETFEKKQFFFPEKPEYFEREVQESSKMTYAELGAYIDELQKGGFEIDHLKTDLYKKIAFPLVNFIMAILGIPFAFSVGKKGALYGITLGVLIGIVYWGAFGVFEVLGGNGLLSPLLAAWGPNILFGASGFLFLSMVRT